MENRITFGDFLKALFGTTHGWIGILLLLALAAATFVSFSSGNVAPGIIFAVLTVLYIIGLIWFLSWAYVLTYVLGTFLLIILRGMFGFGM